MHAEVGGLKAARGRETCSVNGPAYQESGSEWLVPQLQQAGIEDSLVLQQDGAPAYFALQVCRYLNTTFSNRWIGRGSANDQAPFAWPPRSPDLTTSDDVLWEFIKDKMRNHH
ncbi:hypothetical protein ANN_16111 [Periplaneta americana]|uniref:Transposase n=1 Tax=Periplaneta americana TaxID=6978 RepID=A0ABQ8SI40_PERAM|nr:hypothetical protein ANN_16111 [Periplaneta americana]